MFVELNIKRERAFVGRKLKAVTELEATSRAAGTWRTDNPDGQKGKDYLADHFYRLT